MSSFLKTLQGTKTPTPPIWFMRQAGRYLPEYRKVRAEAGDFLTLCYTPKLAMEVTIQPIRRYGFDAAILFSDILVVPDGLGQKVWFEEGAGPRLEPIADDRALAELSLEGLTERLSPVYEAVERIAGALPSETALIGFAGAPWTVATYMVEGRGSADQRAAKLWAFRDPTAFGRLIDLLTLATIEHLSAQIKAGAQAVQIFDTWAGSLAPEDFERYSMSPMKAIRQALAERHPDVPVIGFPRGAGAKLADYLAATGLNGVSLDTSMDPNWAAKTIDPAVTLQGNLDPILLIAGGRQMEEAIDTRLAAMKERPYIFNLGHGILPETPPEHVAAVIDRVRAG